MSLELRITLLVLLAAFLHAVWNALVKTDTDRTLTLGLLSLLSTAVALATVPFVPVPPQAVWGYLALGVAFHLAFKVCLLQAYRAGDLSHVYPLARGTAPLLVWLASGALAGEAPRGLDAVGVGMISLGILSLTFDRGIPRRAEWRPVGFALATGAFVAAYTVMDGLGVRRFGHPIAYTAWLFLCDGLFFTTTALFLRRRQLRKSFGPALLVPIGAGFISLGGYLIVVWALSLGALASVAALRETGVIFAALIGTVVLREPLGGRRVFASVCVAAGVVLLNW
jgi:drug/metabolite transporter (DMT)-like permease